MADRPSLVGHMVPRKGEAAQAPSSEDVSVLSAIPPPPPRRSLSYRPTYEMHQWLQRTSYETQRPIQNIIDEALRLLRVAIEGSPRE